MKKYDLGIIGCGNMAQAIIKAVSANAKDINILVSDLDQAKLDSVLGLATTFTDTSKMVACCDAVLLAVKPQSAVDVLKDLNIADKLIISIMAGVSIKRLQQLTKSDKIVRVMPNLNARVGLSYNGFCCQNLSDIQQEKVNKILNSFGNSNCVKENQINCITGLCGSAPAYVFMFIGAFIDEGISRGFSPIVARDMALSTVLGSAALVKSMPETDINSLVDSVCSKGGTTIQGVNYLRENNFENLIKNAVTKAIEKAEMLEQDR